MFPHITRSLCCAFFLSTTAVIAQTSTEDPLETELRREQEELTTAYETESAETARAVDRDREFALQQQAAMESIDMIDLEGFGSKLEKLSARMRLLEGDLRQSREVTGRLRSLDSVRNALDLTTLQADYFAAMSTVSRLYGESERLQSAADWTSFVDDARALADPASYDGFSEQLAFFREEQKNTLKLPDAGLLDDPGMAAIYTLTAALGMKGEPEEVLEVRRLGCILRFANRADRTLDYIATEVAFARRAGEELHGEAGRLRREVFELVNLEPGKLDRAHVSYFRQQFDPDFVRQRRATIRARLREVEELARSQHFYRNYLAMSLRKADFALEQLPADCGEEPTLEELETVLDAKKNVLRDRITEARELVEQD
jgi:hypothetical protein